MHISPLDDAARNAALGAFEESLGLGERVGHGENATVLLRRQPSRA